MGIFHALFGILVFCPLFVQASVVAIVDSGTDMIHKDIAPQAWLNSMDNTKNGVDEDGNGFPDDIHGWNFAEGNNMVIDRKYLGRLTPEIRRFFEIQSQALGGTASEEDIAWAKKKIEDQRFIREIIVYANFMHGTHVGGIAIRENPDSRLLAVKLIPTEAGFGEITSFKARWEQFLQAREDVDSIDEPQFGGEIGGQIGVFLLKWFLKSMAERQMEGLMQVTKYLHGHKVDVSNFSFGVGYTHARRIVEQMGKQFFGGSITEAQIDDITRDFMGNLLEKGKDVVKAAPNTLFVIAAGNDGTDNDQFPNSPANLREANTITVAASLGDRALAKFSCYGATMVDVAAPGVGINSAVPGDKYLPVSGTSQSAPYVSGVASAIKDANPALTPAEIKKVIMDTVDKKDFLTGKVKSGGLVSPTRAFHAAELSLIMPLSEAISSANLEIVTFKPNFLGFDRLEAPEVSEEAADLVLPLNSPFVFR